MIWAVLPLKDLNFAKQRLAAVITPNERQGLFKSMVEDVLSVLQALEEIERLLIVSDDATARVLGEKYNAVVLAENAIAGDTSNNSGLNRAAAKASAYAIDHHVDSLLIIHGDLPLVNRKEMGELIEKHRQAVASSTEGSAVTVAPDREGQGTNVMLCTPPDAIEFHYGIGSCGKHLNSARSLGLMAQSQTLSGLGLDIDTPQDLLALVQELPDYADARHTTQYLWESGIAKRLLQNGSSQKGSEPSASEEPSAPEEPSVQGFTKKTVNVN